LYGRIWTRENAGVHVVKYFYISSALLPFSISFSKSLKLGFYGHTTRKNESLEKEMVQGCVPGYRTRGVGQMTSPNGLGWRSTKRLQQRKIVILRSANPSYGGWH